MIKSTRRTEGEFEQSVLDISRVARVVAGGKRLSFRATVALGKEMGIRWELELVRGKM